MRVSGTDFMGSQGEVAFEWRGVHGRPPLASPRGRQGSEQVAVTAESRARRPVFLLRAVGRGRSGVGAARSAGVAASLTPSFSLRAFYLERSNLPTDASTTAVKIDQVVPPPPPRCGVRAGWGALGSWLSRQGQNPGRAARGLCSPSSRKPPG